MKKRCTVWRLIAKALGEKAGKNNTEADRIAFIRLLITLQILLTNFFIIFGVTKTHIMKSSTQSLIHSLSQELNATVEHQTIVTKNHTQQQIILTYDFQRRQNGGVNSQQSSQ